MSDTNDIDLSNPVVQEEINKQVEAAKAEAARQLDAMRHKNTQLIDEYKQFKSRFDGFDPEEFRALQEKLNASEEGQLIKEGKIDEAVEQRAARKMEQERAKHQSTVKGFEGQVHELSAKLEAANAQISGLVIDGAVRDAMAKAGGVPEAVEDAIRHARSVFRLEDGKPVARDQDNNLVTGKDGAISIAEWVEMGRSTHPHRYRQPTGGGAKGNNGSHGGALKRSEMTQQQKTDFVAQHGTAEFLKLPM